LPGEEISMPYRLAALCAALILLTPATRGQADYVDGAALHEAGLVKFWQLQLPLQKDQGIVAAYLVDDQIYLTTQDGYTYTVHAHTGAIRWIKQVTTGGYRVRRPCHAGNRTIIVTPPAIMQYDRYTGQPIRKTELRFPSASAPVSDGVRLYIGGIDRRIYAFYLDQDFETWKALAGGQVISRPALSASGKYLYFASEDGSVYACTASNKALYWQTRTHGSITADLVVDEQNLYVACCDHSLYSLAPDNGGRRWLTRFSGPLYESPTVIPGYAFQYCADDGVVALRTGLLGETEERVQWVLRRGRSLLAADEQQAYVLSRDESILVVKLKDGTVLHVVPAPGFNLPIPSPHDLALYVASKDGRIFCTRKRGVPPLLADEVRQASRGPAGPAAGGPETPGETTPAPEAEADRRESKRPGPPIGGKSKVSKEYSGE
jgi:hypothetical protein